MIYLLPPKFNIDPEKWWLEDYFPIGKVALTFQGSMLNFRRVHQGVGGLKKH